MAFLCIIAQVLRYLAERDYFADENDPEAGAQWPEVLQKMRDPGEFCACAVWT